MSVAVDRVARKYLNVVAGNAINVDIPCFSEDHVVVLYGRVGNVAVLDTDYTVALDVVGGYDDFTVTPTASLITKINALIAADPDEANQIVVRRKLDMLTDITPETAYFRKTLATEFDKTAMRFQQLVEVDSRSIKISATETQEGGAFDLELPDAAARANKAMVFDADGNVAVSVDDYNDQAADAAASAAAALASQNAAATYATNAANSATAAANSATAAATSATNASNSATASATSATNAGDSATAAATSATNASNSATAAAGSATTATNEATAAANSATAAAASATTATNEATAASTSATNASNSATAAATSATNAGNSATAAATSATNAANSATAAAASAAAVNLPSALGHGTHYIRQKATEDGFEYRTPAQVLSDIGAPTTATVKALLQPVLDAAVSAMILADINGNNAAGVYGRVAVDDFETDTLAAPTNYDSTNKQYKTKTGTPGGSTSSSGWAVGQAEFTFAANGDVYRSTASYNYGTRRSTADLAGDFTFSFTQKNETGNGGTGATASFQFGVSSSAWANNNNLYAQNNAELWFFTHNGVGASQTITFYNAQASKGTATRSIANGDVFTFKRRGTVLTVEQNGTTIFTFTDFSSTAALYQSIGVGGTANQNPAPTFGSVSWLVNGVGQTNPTWTTQTFTLASRPTDVHAYLVVKDNVSVVNGTDRTVECSIDGGATWANPASYTDIGAAGSDKVIRASFDVSAQNGTSLKLRVKGLNSKDWEWAEHAVYAA